MDAIRNQAKTRTLLSDIEIQSHGQDTEKVSSFCYLGFMLDEYLSWNEHVEIICNKVSKRLGLLSRIRPYLTQKAAKCVYYCLIQPIFNYTDTVWGGLSIGCSTREDDDRRSVSDVRVDETRNTKNHAQVHFSL